MPNSAPAWIESATPAFLLLPPATTLEAAVRLARETGLLVLPWSPAHGWRTVLTHGRPAAREVRP